jgi:hypothetical protein
MKNLQTLIAQLRGSEGSELVAWTHFLQTEQMASLLEPGEIYFSQLSDWKFLKKVSLFRVVGFDHLLLFLPQHSTA